jgi:lysozyme
MTEARDLLIDLIKEFEGCKLQAYRCPAGIPTIGWGFTQGVRMGDTCTQEEADERLLEEAEQYLATAFRLSPRLRSATPGQQAAIADFIYNCGEGNYKSSTLKRNVDVGDFNEAKHSIKMWGKATDPKTGKKITLPGLVRRRQKEADLL